jgi:hypothetical protein
MAASAPATEERRKKSRRFSLPPMFLAYTELGNPVPGGENLPAEGYAQPTFQNET